MVSDTISTSLQSYRALDNNIFPVGKVSQLMFAYSIHFKCCKYQKGETIADRGVIVIDIFILQVGPILNQVIKVKNAFRLKQKLNLFDYTFFLQCK